MTASKDPHNSEAETQALLVPDTRTAAERKLAQMMTERGADEQGAEAYPILRQIAVELLADQSVPVITPEHLLALAKTASLDLDKVIAAFKLAEQPAQQEPFCYHDGRSIVGKEFADHSDVFPLYTSPPAQPAQQTLAKCWKCGDSDSAYTDVCQVPACGMREA